METQFTFDQYGFPDHFGSFRHDKAETGRRFGDFNEASSPSPTRFRFLSAVSVKNEDAWPSSSFASFPSPLGKEQRKRSCLRIFSSLSVDCSATLGS